MVVGLLGNVVNAALAWSLIYGHFGLPALGVRGARLRHRRHRDARARAAASWLCARTRARRCPERDRARGAALARGGGARACPPASSSAARGWRSPPSPPFSAAMGAAQMAAHQIALEHHPRLVPPRHRGGRGGERARGPSLGQRRLAEADRVTARRAGARRWRFMTACGRRLRRSSARRSRAPSPTIPRSSHVARAALPGGGGVPDARRGEHRSSAAPCAAPRTCAGWPWWAPRWRGCPSPGAAFFLGRLPGGAPSAGGWGSCWRRPWPRCCSGGAGRGGPGGRRSVSGRATRGRRRARCWSVEGGPWSAGEEPALHHPTYFGALLIVLAPTSSQYTLVASTAMPSGKTWPATRTVTVPPAIGALATVPMLAPMFVLSTQ